VSKPRRVTPLGGTSQESPRQALRAAFLRRSVSLLERLSERASAETLTAALAAPSDVGGVATLLSDLAPLDVQIDTIDPLAEALARGAALKQELLAAGGGPWSAGQVARTLGISRQAVDKRRQRRALLAVPSGAGDYLYPACQFTPDGVLPGLDEFLRSFPDPEEDPWTQLSVLLAPAESLSGQSALDVLRAGDTEGAAGVARTFGEHGA